MSANTAFHIAVLPGDGIGPEVMAPALDILRRIEETTPSLKFRFSEGPAGADFYRGDKAAIMLTMARAEQLQREIEQVYARWQDLDSAAAAARQ